MAAPSAPNFTLEGSRSKIRLGTTAVPVTKVTPPKESIKTEAIRRLGEQVAEIRTLGIYEIDGGSIMLESAVFSSLLLPKLQINGFSQTEWVLTMAATAPGVVGYTQVWERCRFVGTEHEAIEATEKALQIVLPISVIQMFHKGGDGQYHSLAVKPRMPSAAASAFML
jgi:hypothetical protein